MIDLNGKANRGLYIPRKKIPINTTQSVPLNSSMPGKMKVKYKGVYLQVIPWALSSWSSEVKITHRAPFGWNAAQAETCCRDLSLTPFKGSQKR